MPTGRWVGGTTSSGNPIDSYGHGTHVAGIVAGTGAAGSGEDFSGVAPDATLVDLKIADVHQGVDCTVTCDLGWEINALAAYEYAIEHRADDAFSGGLRIVTNYSVLAPASVLLPLGHPRTRPARSRSAIGARLQ